MSEEIKPCPFCGKDTKEYVQVLKTHGRELYYVTCYFCHAKSGERPYRDHAIKLWNYRPYDYDMPAIVKKVQRMEAAINQAITDCIPLLSWVDDDDTAVEMVEHLSEILGGALCKQPE